MNPIAILRRERAVLEPELAALENKYSWLKGWGTGWLPQHYGMSDVEWDAIHARHFALRGRIIAIEKEIALLKRVSGPRHKTSSLAHGGR